MREYRRIIRIASADEKARTQRRFYFQKQMQQQTEMTVVLEDGEELRGTIQWYDKCVDEAAAWGGTVV